MLVHWNSHFLSPNIQNKCFSERFCLDAWFTQFRLFAGSFDRYIFYPIFTTISEQILIGTRREGSLFDKTPLSFRFTNVC